MHPDALGRPIEAHADVDGAAERVAARHHLEIERVACGRDAVKQQATQAQTRVAKKAGTVAKAVKKATGAAKKQAAGTEAAAAKKAAGAKRAAAGAKKAPTR